MKRLDVPRRNSHFRGITEKNIPSWRSDTSSGPRKYGEISMEKGTGKKSGRCSYLQKGGSLETKGVPCKKRPNMLEALK